MAFFNFCRSIIVFSFLYFLSFSICFAQESHSNDQHADAPAKNHEDMHQADHRDIKIGERLFFGLTGSAKNKVNCASCHNTDVLDTLNWNPSAFDIAISSKSLDSAAYANILLFPLTKKLTEAHEGISLNAEEIILIRLYLAGLEHDGLSPRKPDVSRMIFFLFLVLLFSLSIADLIFFRKIGWKMIPYTVIILTLAWGTKMVAHDSIDLGRSKSYAPLQPIKFSHKVHAGEDQIDCQYCHHTAEMSKSAGLPAMGVCMNCHVLIRDGSNSGRFEINKIHAAIDEGHPVEWVRIHRLPDYVFFSHAQHVGAGKLNCVECHGAVEEMQVMKQYSSLSMGWCLDCHRSRKVDFLGNDYYKMTFRELNEQISKGKIDSVLVEEIGGTNCMKCHY